MSQELNKRYQIFIEITLFNPFTPNGISHSSQLDQSIFVLRGVGWHFSFLFKFNRTFCKQTVDTLIRRRVLLCLIWVSHKGRSPENSFCLLPILCFPCPCSVGKPDACSFFLGFFFSRTLDCLVSNCSWMNSQFIGIKFTVLPSSPSYWNIRKKVSNHV